MSEGFTITCKACGAEGYLDIIHDDEWQELGIGIQCTKCDNYELADDDGGEQ